MKDFYDKKYETIKAKKMYSMEKCSMFMDWKN